MRMRKTLELKNCCQESFDTGIEKKFRKFQRKKFPIKKPCILFLLVNNDMIGCVLNWIECLRASDVTQCTDMVSASV